jgi:acetyl-CoA carboxylase biotin carboxyl carrier protein
MLPGAIPAAMGAQFPNPNMQIPVSSGGNGAAAAAAPGTADGTGHTGGTSGEAAAAADEAAGDSGLEQITSPIVGTFYRSPAPDSPPYVEEGTEIKEGETLCIIEAMKVMNELEAEFDLRVERVLVENGAMVEYGSPILEVRRL